MLVVSLIGFALLIIFNTVALQRIAEGNKIIRDITNPQYKVSQIILRNINGFKISLLHILNTPQLQEGNRNVLANEQRVDDLKGLISALQHGGPIIDVAKVANRVAGGFSPPAPTPPGMRVRTGRFKEITGPWPGSECAPKDL